MALSRTTLTWTVLGLATALVGTVLLVRLDLLGGRVQTLLQYPLYVPLTLVSLLLTIAILRSLVAA